MTTPMTPLWTYPPVLLVRRGRRPRLYPPCPVPRKLIAYKITMSCMYGKFGNGSRYAEVDVRSILDEFRLVAGELATQVRT